MGLFSFVKNAGAKLFKKKPKKVEAVDNAEANKEQADELAKVIEDLGFFVDYLNITVDDDKVTISGVAQSQEEKEKIILAVGNVDGIATVDDQLEVADQSRSTEEKEEKAASVFYTVVKGDYLSKIAKKQYGDAMKYPIIFEANKPMLKDPDLIYPGQVLRIPPLEDAQA